MSNLSVVRISNLPPAVSPIQISAACGDQVGRQNKNKPYVYPIVTDYEHPETKTCIVALPYSSRVERDQLLSSLQDYPVVAGNQRREIRATEDFTGATTLIEPEDGNSDFDIIFIHGLGGHAFKTWCSQPEQGRNQVMWPHKYLYPYLQDEHHLRCRIVLFGHGANAGGRRGVVDSIQDIARDLLDVVEKNQPEGRERPIFFICHSLGGLILCQAIATALCPPAGDRHTFEEGRKDKQNGNQVRQSKFPVKGAVFFSTPFKGSPWASRLRPIVRMLGGDDDIMSLLQVRTHDRRVMLSQFYDVRQRRYDQVPDVAVFFERFPLKRLRLFPPIVDRNSALGLFPDQQKEHGLHYKHYGINDDHIGMTKFRAWCHDLDKVEEFLSEMICGRINPDSQIEALTNLSPQNKPSDRFQIKAITGGKAHASWLVGNVTEEFQVPGDTTLAVTSVGKHQGMHWCHQLQEVPEAYGGTCKWIQGELKFHNWLSSGTGAVLFIEGRTGFGKSVLARSIIENLQRNNADDMLVTYFFCRNQDGRNTTKAVLRSVVDQIMDANPSILPGDDFRGQAVHSLEHLWRLFTRARPLIAKSLVVVVNAIDECLPHCNSDVSSNKLDAFIQDLRRVCALAESGATKILFLTRQDGAADTIHNALCHKYPRISLEENHVLKDVEVVVQHRVRQLIRDRRLPDNLFDDIVTKIMGICGGDFKMGLAIIGVLRADARNDGSKEAIMHILDKLPEKTLESIYSETMSLIPEDEIRRAANALKLVLFAKRPLTVDEIKHALATLRVEINGDSVALYTTFQNKIPTNIVDEALLGSCGSLVQKVELSHEEGTTIQILNQAMKNYLRDWKSRSGIGFGDERSAHLLLAKMCLTYLLVWLPVSNNIVHKTDENHGIGEAHESRAPFLKYAAQFWMVHVKHAGSGIDDILHLINELMRADKSNNRRWWTYYCNEVAKVPSGDDGIPEEFIIARFDLLNVLQRSCKIVPPLRRLRNIFRSCHEKDPRRETIHLSHDLQLNAMTPQHETLMHICAEFNSREVLKYLISYGLPPTSRDDDHDTPFSTAALIGHEELALDLLRLGADDDNDDKDYPKVLHSVAERNLLQLGELLLQSPKWAAKVDCTAKGGVTPLHLALVSKHKNIVELLLGKGANPTRPDSLGTRPVHYAAKSGDVNLFERIVGQVSSEEVKAINNDNWNVLHYAALGGSATLVRLLIERYHVQPTTSMDGRGWQPIHCAMVSGNLPVVKVLAGIQNLTEPTEDGFVPLHLAASIGATSLVEWLVGHNVNVNFAREKTSQTALMFAANGRHIETVEALLNGEPKADAGATGATGWNVLHHAVGSGDLNIVKRILRESPYDTDISQKTRAGSTALSLAIEAETYDIADTLLGYSRPDEVNSLHGGCTLIFLAVKKGNVNLVSRLESMKADPIIRTNMGSTIAHAVAESGSVFLLRKFEDAIKAVINVPNHMDELPIHVAAKFNNVEVLRYLVKGTQDINHQTRFGSTALIGATKRKANSCASILLDNGANTNVKDGYGLSALDWGLEVQVKVKETKPTDPPEQQRTSDKPKTLVKTVSSLPPDYSRHTSNIRASIAKEFERYTAAEPRSGERWVCLVVLGYLFLALRDDNNVKNAFRAASNGDAYPEFYDSWYCLQCKKRIFGLCHFCHTCLSMVCNKCYEQKDESKVAKWAHGCQSDHDLLRFDCGSWMDMPEREFNKEGRGHTEADWIQEVMEMFVPTD